MLLRIAKMMMSLNPIVRIANGTLVWLNYFTSFKSVIQCRSSFIFGNISSVYFLSIYLAFISLQIIRLVLPDSNSVPFSVFCGYKFSLFGASIFSNALAAVASKPIELLFIWWKFFGGFSFLAFAASKVENYLRHDRLLSSRLMLESGMVHALPDSLILL